MHEHRPRFLHAKLLYISMYESGSPACNFGTLNLYTTVGDRSIASSVYCMHVSTPVITNLSRTPFPPTIEVLASLDLPTFVHLIRSPYSTEIMSSCMQDVSMRDRERIY